MVDAGAVTVVAETAALIVVAVFLAGVLALWSLVRTARRRLARWRPVAAPVSDPRWWLTQRDRHRMWRAVSSAEKAVQAAVSADAPVGDLPFLVRRLDKAARSVDAVVRAGGDRAEVQETVRTAEDIRAAAVEALTSVARPETTSIAADVRLEIAALRHGLAAARR
jgi:hypothetical protein